MSHVDELLKDLNDEQREAVLHTEGPCLVIAGPGSGKTKALTTKIVYLMVEKGLHPDQILAVTFTNKAAKEMKHRVNNIIKGDLSSLKMGYENLSAPGWIGTFHSICARILRTESVHLEIDRNFVIYDTDDSEKLIKDILVELDISPKDLNPGAVLGSISKAKGELITPEKYSSEAYGYFFERVAKIYPKYQKALTENNAIDFSDLLTELVYLFIRKPEVLDKYQNQFRYVLIDEYQDTNRVQYEIVKAIAAKNRNITVVGDVSQSIYSWRGADYKNMLSFQKDYPEAVICKLAKNYRSTQNIIDAAKYLIENNTTHMALDLYTDNHKGSKIVLFEAENERTEARFISQCILDGAYNGENNDEDQKFSKYAILYRTNAQSRALEEQLIKDSIPYRIVGGVRFYDRKEIKDVISYLRVFCNPKDSVSWGRCINTPPRKIGPKALQKVKEAGYDLVLIEDLTKREWKKYITMCEERVVSPLVLLDYVLKDFGYLEYLNDGTDESTARIENIKELRTVAKQFNTIEEFLENISLVESSNKADTGSTDAVTLMTIHAAKGLEFDTVFIAGLEEGIFPHSRALADKNELEEERRLAYVAITRAKRDLVITYTRQRTFYGQTSGALISRFVSEIPEELIVFRFG